MSQIRLNIYGSTVETGDGPIVISNIMSPGRLQGNDFKVLGADLLGVGAGSCLLPDGVLLLEDEDKKLVIPNSSAAVDYTIAYQLEDSRVLGGSPAVLRLISGIIRQDSFTDATILGWIRYSGGSVPLADSMFIQPTSLKIVPQDDTLSFTIMAPFSGAVRPSIELSGSKALVAISLENGQLPQTIIKSLGGRARIISATVMSDLGIAASVSSYLTYAVKKGTTPLFALSTSATSLVADVPSPLSTASSTALSSFVFEANESPTLEVTRIGLPSPIIIGGISLTPLTFTKTGGAAYAFSQTDLFKTMFFRSGTNTGAIAQIIEIVSGTVVRLREMGQTFIGSTADAVEMQNAGEVMLTVETPPTTGKWVESIVTLTNELVSRFTNISSSAELYTLKIPFIIGTGGQPRKLISRLNVDYNCIVTLRLRVNGTAVVLSPANGAVSNTGTLITSELNIPVSTSITWSAGATGIIEVEINAQSGRGASFAYFALVQEASPFRIFA